MGVLTQDIANMVQNQLHSNTICVLKPFKIYCLFKIDVCINNYLFNLKKSLSSRYYFRNILIHKKEMESLILRGALVINLSKIIFEEILCL